MASPTHINDLPDDLLVRILWHSKKPMPIPSDCDAFWDPYDGSWPSTAAFLLESQISQDDLPALANPRIGLDIALICRRWCRLARRHVTTLAVAGDNIRPEHLASNLTCFPNLTHLHVCDYSMRFVDDTFLDQLASACPKITRLRLGAVEELYAIDEISFTATGLDRFVQRLTQLQQLSLKCLNWVVQLPPSVYQLVNLRTLDIKQPSVLDGPGLTSLSSLTDLTVSSSFNHQQLAILVHLSKLTRLSLSGRCSQDPSDQRSAPFTLEQFPCMKSLEVSWYCPPIDLLIPGPSTSLERLSLSHCSEIHSLPEVEELLPRLQQLVIRGCDKFSQLPGTLPPLKLLVLDRLPLAELPSSVCQLTSLETLVLTDLQEIQQLPPRFSSLTSLHTLCLVNLPNLVLPETQGSHTKLQSLLLDRCSQDRLPSSYTQLVSLARLEFHRCQINELPECLGNLSKLQQLHIRFCPNIRRIPESITTLTALEILVVGRCEALSFVPMMLDGVKRLKWLELTDCRQLTDIPVLLPPSLEVLSLGNFHQALAPPDFDMLPNLKRLTLKLIGVEHGSEGTDCARAVIHSASHPRKVDLLFGRDAEYHPYRNLLRFGADSEAVEDMLRSIPHFPYVRLRHGV